MGSAAIDDWSNDGNLLLWKFKLPAAGSRSAGSCMAEGQSCSTAGFILGPGLGGGARLPMITAQ